MSEPELKHYHWRSAPYKGDWFYSVSINRDGSLYNPNHYPEEAVREACLEADRQKAQKLIAARKQGVETRKRRREEKIAKVAKDYLLGKQIGNDTECAICGKGLSDPVSVERGVGSECWPQLMTACAEAIPNCEAEIAGYRAQIVELGKQDRAFFEAKWPRRGQADADYDKIIAYEFKQKGEYIEQLGRRIRNAELLLAAARRWQTPLLLRKEA